MNAQASVCRQRTSRVRRDEQGNPQNFAVQELACQAASGAQQLEFREITEGARIGDLFVVVADDKSNRATRLFDLIDPAATVAYRFVETESYPAVRFCWTVERNAAGRFLTFRERVNGAGVHRDQFNAFLKKSTAIRESKANRDALDAKRKAKRMRAMDRKTTKGGNVR